MKTILRFIGSTLILGMLAWVLIVNVAISPSQATIRQLEEAPGQVVYQSRQVLKDQKGASWQAIAFKRTFPDRSDSIYLRLVGFPGTANIDHSQPLTLTNSMGKTLTAADVSHDMFVDPTQIKPDVAQYDLQPILMKLELGIPLRLILPTLDQSEITLNASTDLVEEWRSLIGQK
ncbi:DUF3122 domain-containing protein [Candidatus Synechococcus calcipolaris G9]|uniref:DUF3122 domain-containing protein n=1 Tax=Candidatus Synechococcus calcipolaris G9 TaxID=1497997 RepID=A0ABT6F2T0_9SYNE|nr:DUF3122 domain-containing protein [Candidatus Synechococcus calcipolaris]MDG2992166.1 DUF3122 domain-containing protein [Candidatus Synechococcus calcipolaris G9]